MHLKAAGVGFEREVRLPTSERRFRWDFHIFNSKLLVDVQGATWIRGAHSSGAGLARDYAKNNEAILLGWRPLYFDKQMIESGIALQTIEAALGRTC